jgi:hypothetical protein
MIGPTPVWAAKLSATLVLLLPPFIPICFIWVQPKDVAMPIVVGYFRWFIVVPITTYLLFKAVTE